MSEIHIPRLRMAVTAIPAPPIPQIGNWPLSRILQIAGYIGVMVVAMRTFPEPLNHWVPVILFGVTAATIGMINAFQACSMSYLETNIDLSYPRSKPTYVFPLPPDLEEPRRVYTIPCRFDPIGIIA